MPRDTESLAGYVIRLTETNGYQSPRDIYKLAGMKGEEASMTNLSASKIAQISGQQSSSIDRLGLTPSEEEPRVLRLLGQRVCKADLTLTGARVCPSCIAEKGFIEAHLHIEVMVACPIHRKMLIWFCPSCKTRVSWNRPGLLTCSCGAPLEKEPAAEISAPEIWLLDQIRQKALNKRQLPFGSRNILDRQLQELDLLTLLCIVRYLGRHRLAASRSPDKPLGRSLLRAAASVLEDWPNNFTKLLQNIDPLSPIGSKEVAPENLREVQEIVAARVAGRYPGGTIPD